MAVEILVPKLGLTMTEGTINEWLVEPGAEVAVGDVSLRLATDKVDVDVEAEAAGIFHPGAVAGESLEPGAVIGWLLTVGEEPPEHAAAAVPPTSAGAGDATVDVVVAPEVAAELTNTSGVQDDPAPAAPMSTTADGRLMASPNARRVARQHGVEIAQIRGTGPGGRIVSEDVDELVAEIAAVPTDDPAAGDTGGPHTGTPLVRRRAVELGVDLAGTVPTGPGGKLTRSDVLRAADAPGSARPPTAPAVPATAGQPAPQHLTGLRGAIARNMMASLHEMAQLTLGHEADLTELAATRAALKAENALTGRRTPTITDFVVRAAATALREHPLMNSTLRDGQTVPSAAIHVGIAVSLDGGLVVPVLRNADVGSLGELAEQAASLAAAARAGKLSLPQLEGATFTVSSLGASGIDFFTPIINRGNVGILGVGRMRDGVRWEGDRPVRTQVLTLSLTFDHRVVDGAPAAAYLMAVSDLLARPLALLAG